MGGRTGFTRSRRPVISSCLALGLLSICLSLGAAVEPRVSAAAAAEGDFVLVLQV